MNNELKGKKYLAVNQKKEGHVMKAADIKKIAVLGGSGLIGSSWVTFFLWKGLDVNVYDVNANLLDTARERIDVNLSYLVEKSIVTKEAKEKALRKIFYTKDLPEAFRNAQYIQECAPERYEPKQELVAALDKYGSPETIFASSTSGLIITEIAKYSRFPQRCVGAHPYNPPHLIPLVEISKGDKTSADTVQITYDFFKAVGKEPVIMQKEAPGFISNRLQMAVYREAVDMVIRGVCSVEDVDKALCYGPGLRYALMGQTLIFHLGGGKGGLKGFQANIGKTAEVWLADMADWKKWPEGCADVLQAGVDKEIANRSVEEGKTSEEIIRWRNDKLLALLKILNKI
ncbi:MAG TPA: 3-hydroxyacyl-CoA dehydrogenase family protein [Smithellaceae bacterium]|nr:3-hydroxyacyl-CoA dehydrogenase family protein [Smithellaceae bacterium]